MTLFNNQRNNKLRKQIKKILLAVDPSNSQKINDVLVVGGGVIPEIDHKDLIKAGVDHVFGPGTPLPTIIDHINTGVGKLRKI